MALADAAQKKRYPATKKRLTHNNAPLAQQLQNIS